MRMWPDDRSWGKRMERRVDQHVTRVRAQLAWMMVVLCALWIVG